MRVVWISVAAVFGLIVGVSIGNSSLGLVLAIGLGLLASRLTGPPRDRQRLPAPVARTSELKQEPPSAPATAAPKDAEELSKIEYAMEFLQEARDKGILGRSAHLSLNRLLELRKEEIFPAPVAVKPAARTAPAPIPAPPPPAPLSPASQPTVRPPRKTAAARAPAKASVKAPAPPRPPALPPPPPHEPVVLPLLAKAGEKLSGSMGRVWKAFASDFALHSLTYIGVLLSVVVVFVFFAFGFFGEVFRVRNSRPVVEAAIPLFFFGMAWLLRTRTGIPHTAAAVGLIGALSLPVMLSASFQDGSLCCPPDIEPPARWVAYAVVGVVCAVIYCLLAVRFRPSVYAYLVGPMLWASAGALGLFVADGISSWQLVVVIGAVAATVPLASGLRETGFGKVVSGPVAQMAAVSLLPIFVVALAFAIQEASAVAVGRFRHVAAPSAWAAALAGIGSFAVGRSPVAWKHLSKRVRREVREIASLLSYVFLAAAWLFVAGLGLRIAWLGATLLGYAALIYWFDETMGRTRSGPWAVRASLSGALLLSLLEGYPTLVTWGLVSSLVVSAVLVRSVRDRISRVVVALPKRGPELDVALGASVVVWIGAGLARAFWPGGTVWVLALGALALGATRFLPGAMKRLRSLALLPAVVLGLAGFTVATLQFTAGGPLGPLGKSGVMALLAVAAALVDVSWTARAPTVVLLGTWAMSLALREALGGAAEPAVLADTMAFGAVGAALITDSLVRFRSSQAFLNGALGHVLVYVSFGRGVAGDTAMVVGLAVLVATHAAEAVVVEGRGSPFVSGLARRAGKLADAVLAAPAVIAAAGLPFLVIEGAQRLGFLRAERSRLGLALAALAWPYGALAAVLRARRRIRTIGAAGSFALCGVGIAVVAPSLTGEILAVGSATVVTAGLAWILSRPASSIVAWALAVTFEVLVLERLRVPPGSLYVGIFVSGLVLVLGSAGLDVFLGAKEKPGGVRSPWLRPPLGLGLLLIPAGLAFALADRRFLAEMSLAAAGSYALLGWLVRTGGVALPAAVTAAIAYADLIAGWRSPFEEPILWMPLAAAFVVAGAVGPGRPSWRILDHPSPALVVAGLSSAALALALALREGGEAEVLLATAGLLALVFAVRRERGWVYGSMAALLAGGVALGDGWGALAASLDAVGLGTMASRRRGRPSVMPLVAASTGLVAFAYGSFAAWVGWDPSVLALVTGVASACLATIATVLSLRDSVPHSVGLWLPSAHVLAQAGAATVLVLATLELPVREAYGAGVLVALAEAALLGTVTTLLRHRPWARSGVAGTTGLLILAYAGLPGWAAWDLPTTLFVTALASAGMASLTVAGSWRNRAPALRLWLPSMHVLIQVAAIFLVAQAALFLPVRSAAAWVAVVAVGESIYLAVLAPRAPSDWPLREASAALLVVGGVAATLAQGTEGALPIAVLSGMAAAGLVAWVAVGLARPALGPWHRSALVLASGMAAAAVALAGLLFGPLSRPVAVTLGFAGADLVSYGLMRRQYRLLEGGLLLWFGSALLFSRGVLGANPHVYVVPTSAVLLAVLEIERNRMRKGGEEIPEPFRWAEWALIAAPPILATVDVFENLLYAVLLAVEGAALLVWGLVTEVRRRALLGLSAITAAVILSAAIPLVDVFSRGVSGSTLLLVGGVLAVVLLVAGSILERNRAQVRARLRGMWDAMEDWE